MRFWNAYVGLIKTNCAGSSSDLKDLAYWRNQVFATTIIFLLPLCLIALLPGVYWSIIMGLIVLVVMDILAIAGMLVVAFMPGISLMVRKVIFICCVYLVGCVMLFYIGLYGPGLIYLQVACTLSILIFQTGYKFWAAWLNTLICVGFGVAILVDIIPWSNHQDHSLGVWMAVSSNLVFLSFLTAALLPKLFYGLQETIEKEKKLKEELNTQQCTLEKTLDMLQKKNIEVEQFAYVASHDLKEPLRMVKSFVTLLEKKYAASLDETAGKYIHFAVDGAMRMETLINDLLDYSRAGRINNDIEETDLNEIIDEVKQLYWLIISEKDVIIKTTSLPRIQVSRAAIRHVFQNLIGNAIKYHKAGVKPLINIQALETNSHWKFSIADNGIGLSKNNFKSIFNIFKRLHSKEAYAGTGIGLAICKKIVEQNGGVIWVESDEGKGSTFYFTMAKTNK